MLTLEEFMRLNGKTLMASYNGDEVQEFGTFANYQDAGDFAEMAHEAGVLPTFMYEVTMTPPCPTDDSIESKVERAILEHQGIQLRIKRRQLVYAAA
jgi:hypothetical protein